MRLYKRIFATCMAVLFVLLDTSVLPFSGINMLYCPRMALLSVITIALLLGRTQGILYGAVAGVLMDITVSIPMGLTSIVYTVAGFVSGYLGRKSRYALLSSIISPIISMLIYELAQAGYYIANAGIFSGDMFLMMLIRILIGTFLVQILYLLFNLVLKTKHSRYARR